MKEKVNLSIWVAPCGPYADRAMHGHVMGLMSHVEFTS